MFDAPVPVGGMAPRRRSARDRREGTLFIATFFLVLFRRRRRDHRQTGRTCAISRLRLPSHSSIIGQRGERSIAAHSHRERCKPRIMLTTLAARRASSTSTTGCITTVRMRHVPVVHITPSILRRQASGRVSPLPPPLTPFGSKSQTDALADIATKKFGGIDTRYSDFLVS